LTLNEQFIFMLTTTEIRINEKLFATGCAISNLAAINGTISQSRLSRALAGQKPLEAEDGISLLKTLDEMLELMKTSTIMPNWSKHDRIRDTLRLQREYKEARIKDRIPELVIEHAPEQ
jgi:hypothetical protein